MNIFSLLVNVAHAQDSTGLVPCGRGQSAPCTLKDVFLLAHNLFNYFIELAFVLAVLSFAIAGFYYIFSGGDQSKVSKAHDIFYYTVIGMVLALGAWTLVNTILSGLGVEQAFRL